MIYHFCPQCGERLVLRNFADDKDIPYCTACSKAHFSFSQPCVIAAVINEYDELAVIRPKFPPGSGYTLVAGHVAQGETIEACAVREVLEEIGQHAQALHYFRSYYFDARDQLMFAFLCRVQKSELVISEELHEGQWIPLSKAPEYISGVIGRELLREYEKSRMTPV